MSRAHPKPASHSAHGLRFAIIAARYNARYTDALLSSARDTLAKAGAVPNKIRVVRVPGAFEIPVVAAKLGASRKFNALIALGVILRGETAHADLIAQAITNRLSEISVRHGIPVIHEVLLVANEAQAQVRCLDPKHNRGEEAAHTAIEMARLLKTLKS